MKSIKVTIIEQNNLESITQNFILNRFDIIYPSSFGVIKICSDIEKIVPFHVDDSIIVLGLTLMTLSQEEAKELINFIKQKFLNINYIEYSNALININGKGKENNHYLIKLPSTPEEYLSSLGMKTRKHIRRYFRLIEKDFPASSFEEFHGKGNIPLDVVKKFFELKFLSHKVNYRMDEISYLERYNVTDAFTLKINGEIVAVAFNCVTGKNVYFENFSFDRNYYKYSIGICVFFKAICYYISQGFDCYFLGGGSLDYKKNMSTHSYKTYSNVITIRRDFRWLWQKIFHLKNNPTFYDIRVLGIRIKLRRKLQTLSFEKTDKCLVVAPHPDDELIGVGGTILKNKGCFDCMCIGSSGITPPDNSIDARARSKIRVKEFFNCMHSVGIENKWIFETFGNPPFYEQMISHVKEYISVLNLKKYDYIFLPHPKDGHREHRFITNELFKKILKNGDCKSSLKIVFYEVWKPLKKFNVVVDISKQIDEKIRLMDVYQSQTKYTNYAKKIADMNIKRGKMLNNSYAEVFNVVSLKQYLNFTPLKFKLYIFLKKFPTVKIFQKIKK